MNTPKTDNTIRTQIKPQHIVELSNNDSILISEYGTFYVCNRRTSTRTNKLQIIIDKPINIVSVIERAIRVFYGKTKNS